MRVLDSDVTGPMTRTVADSAAVLQVIAGEDPNDQATAAVRGHAPVRYRFPRGRRIEGRARWRDPPSVRHADSRRRGRASIQRGA